MWRVVPCSSRCSCCFLSDPHWSHQSLDTDHCSCPENTHTHVYISLRKHSMDCVYTYKSRHNEHVFLTVDSLWMRRLGLPRASMISRAYSSLCGLLILSSSFQQRPSPFYTYKQVQLFSVWQKRFKQCLTVFSSACRFTNWSVFPLWRGSLQKVLKVWRIYTYFSVILPWTQSFLMSGDWLTVSSEMFWKACSILGHVGSSIRSSQTRRERFSAWRWSSSHRALCMDTHTQKSFFILWL